MVESPRPHAHPGRPPLASVPRAIARLAVGGVLLSAILHGPAVLAGPTGGRVVAGSGAIQRPNVDTTLIQQRTQSMAIDWTGFDVAGHETVRFQQPSASSAVLNRIFNELPSQIHGRIEANGQVFIMNPNGVVFGSGARVEVGGLFASSLDIDVQDFMSGHYRFTSADGVVPGAVVNRGLIKAATGGGVALIGGAVRNDGVIIADLGHVLMGAGRQALVDFDGDGLIRFHVDEAVLAEVAHEDGAVVNGGEIRADGGQVLLSAAVARGIVDRAVNNQGIIRAASIDRSAGSVRLTAVGAGAGNAGTIDVSASDGGSDAGQVIVESTALTVLDVGSTVAARSAGGRGGEVRVLGESVAMLDAARVDVSGELGGGTVLIGGDYQGANPGIANARRTGIAPGARIDADATGTGDGGKVIVWSDETTNFFGNISARGGASGGDGGFAEVSGKEHLTYRGSADLSAAAGARGTLLLDPAFLEIVGGPGDGGADGDTRFAGTGANRAAGAILFSDSGPSVVYQSEIEAQSATADITLQATRSVSVSGSFTGSALTLAPNSSLLIETRNAGSGETGLINLIGSASGAGLDIVTSGSGTLTVRSGVGGDRNTPILLPNLVSASDIVVSAGGGPSSSVLVFGEVSGRNVDVDATGSVIVLSGARLVAGGDGTSLTVDATGITILDGAPGAASVANSGTGTVSLISTGAADVVLGENAIATGVGLLTLGSGRSIIAVNLTDVSDTVNEITSAGAVALRAAEDIGDGSRHIEIGGVTDLSLDLGDGDFHVSGADGAGGPGSALSRFALGLEPENGNAYVLENFAGQTFDFSTQGYGDDLAIRAITSTSLLDLAVTTIDDGIYIGGAGSTGIRLTGASAVMLDAYEGIEEAVIDDGGVVVAEITTDGRLTLVAKDTIGGNGMLDVAAAAGGVSALEAASTGGSVRINALQALRVEGSGIQTAGGGILAAAGGLTIAANVDTGAGITLTATDNGARAGDDVTIASGAVVTLDSSSGAALTVNAGDSIVFDGGRIETRGAGAHRVDLLADREGGGADGVTGRVSQTGAGLSLSSERLTVTAGGGIGAGAALETEVENLSAINSTSGDVLVSNRGAVTLSGDYRNDAQGGALTLINDNGAVDAGTAHVAAMGGPVTLEARESDPAAPPGDNARINIGAAGLQSGGADLVVRAADSIIVNGPVDSGGGKVTLQAGLDAIEAAPDGIGDLRIGGNIDAGAGEAALSAGGAIQQLAGRIAAASMSSTSGGATTLDRPANGIARFAATAGGDVALRNAGALALGASDVGGNLHIDNAQSVAVADLVQVAGTATIDVAAGNIDGAGGRIAAGNLELDAAGGIGVGAVLGTEVSGDVFLRSRGVAAAGDIRILQTGDLTTTQIKLLTTDTGSVQSVALAAANVLTVDKDPVDTPNLQNGDSLELDAARIDLAEKISGRNVDVRFKAPVDVTANTVFIDLGQGMLTFEGNVSPGANTTLDIRSEVAFASGRVTGKPDSTLIVADTLDLVTDTTIEVDNLFLSGNPASLAGTGDLTLLPATHGRDIVIGGNAGLVPDVTLATLQGFGGGRALDIGVPAFPARNSPLAGNVSVGRGLAVADAVLTVGGLGDVTLGNHGDPLASSRAVNIIAVGDRRVFPGLVNHSGGDILDTDASAGASPTLEAPTVNLIAQARVGDASNALEVAVGAGGGVNFVTGAGDAFINTIPPGQPVNNVLDNSPILAAFQAQGFFSDALSGAALARTVGLETTGLETTGLGELLYVDEGVFLLPDPYTTPIQATLLPPLMDPDFPADRRPDDPDDEQGWQSFYSGALKDYVQARYLIPEDAGAAERAAIEARAESEWRTLVTYFENLRDREQAAMTSTVPAVGG